MNMSVTQGQYLSKLKHAKVIPIYKGEDKETIGQFLCHPTLIAFLKRVMFMKFFIGHNMAFELNILRNMQSLTLSTLYKVIWTTNYSPAEFLLI